MIYLDSSAVVKLIHEETASDALMVWLAERPGHDLVSSALIEIEVPRALRRDTPAALSGVPPVLARIYRMEVDAIVRATAASYPHPSLRSLDAIHLATAQIVLGSPDRLEAFVAYDRRLLSVAADLGFATASPGIM